MKKLKIAVDFDGTCVDHRFPSVGKSAPDAVRVLRKLAKDGHKLFLFTMRSRVFLEDAISWFVENEIDLSGIQVDPEQGEWTSSPKCYADVYIDDRGIGVPLVEPPGFNGPVVDWNEVEKLLLKKVKHEDPA